MIANFNRQQYIRDWKRQHHSYERSQYPNFKSALDKQIAPVVDFIQRHGVGDLEKHLTVLVSAQPMQEAYLKCYTRIGVNHASWIYNRIDKIASKKSFSIDDVKEAPSFFSEQWRKLMSLFYHTDGGKRITQVTDTTRESVMKLLDDSQDMPLSDRANYLVDNLNNPDFNRNRGLVIARTESTTAAGYGALLGAESSDYETGKMWLAVMDANTRVTHADTNEQVVGIDETFFVGGSLMQYPGDPSGSAAEVINCRCCLAVVPLVSESGLPILKVA